MLSAAKSQATMKYVLVLATSAILLLNSFVQSDNRVFDRKLSKKITISFNDSLSRGRDVKTEVEKCLLNFSPNEISELLLKNVTTGVVFKKASFDAYLNLTKLTIVDSQINDFPEATFEGLNNLTNLELSNIGLRSVSANLFSGMPKLQFLNLDNNDLEDFPAGVFKNLPEIALINADQNRLKAISKEIFQLEKLQLLSVEKNVITTLEKDTFLAEKLRMLYLNSNKVSRIDKNTFENLRNLETVEMSGTFTDQVESLPKELFSNSTKLLVIKMNGNHFKSLEVGIFHNLRKLNVLDISSNMLTNLPGDIFENNIRLQKLNLTNNKLQYLSENIFTSLSELLSLDLSDNKLGHLDAEIFSKLTRLSDFYISNNKVDLAVAGSDFSVLKRCLNLTNIRANNANISKVFTDWRTHPQLQVLNLTFNPLPLSQINAKFERPVSFYFTSNSNTIVQLQVKWSWRLGANAENDSILDKDPKCEHSAKGCSCKISYFPNSKKIILLCVRFEEDKLNEWPSDVVERSRRGYDIELELSNCNLTSLYPVYKYVRVVKNRVTKLALSGNNLNNLNDLKEDLPALKELELDRNKFKTFEPTAVQFLKRSKNLTKITLHQNPWMCNCSLQDFYYFVKDDKNPISQKDEITCSNIPDKAILNLEFEEICPLDRGLITSVFIFFVAFASICFFLLYYYYTHEEYVKALIFSIRALRFLVTEKEVDRHKKYDVFVSYAAPDEWFVVEELVPKLEEGEHPYAVCFHQRDWLAGDYIPTQIERSVEQSRRTVIVMSPNFLNSSWGKKEFHSAYMKSMRERCSRILIILLQDIDKSKLDKEMKAYISMNTYLEWKDPNFWLKLKYALPHTYVIRIKRTHEEIRIR